MSLQSEEDQFDTTQTGKKAFGAFLKAFLKRESLKITWLADQTGLHRVTLSRLTNGHFLPDTETCQRIAVALGLPVEHLMQLAGYLPATSTPAQSINPDPAEEGLEIYDPELALQFQRIGELSAEDIQFFKSFLAKEIGERQRRHLAGQSEAARPPFARPLPTSSTSEEQS